MLTIPGVIVQNQIYESANSLVYRAIQTQDNQPIILKLLKENYPTPQELARYRTEYQITKSLNIPGVIKVYDLQKYENTLVMFLEDFGGESLKFWMHQRPFNLTEFLNLAIKITQILGEIHAANIIHKDINPANIIFNANTQELKIIDFGISTQLNKENTTLKNPKILEGTLNYMSPEQTGRMNRPIDYRSDFYSLGITFYELLTNQLPFISTDALELVHCHIAKPPRIPREIKPEIPLIISEIILKLMAKNAEDRYQSAFGIIADLEECLNQLQTNHNISEFPLARQDISDKFQISQKLYGREREIETLLTAFERVSSSQSELILIAGYSGIGKSALVQELYKPITEKRGYFIAGKFDQYQRNIPYSAVVIAFQDLIKQLLTESIENLEQWREKILTAVGDNGQVIAEVIPEIELIIGKQPAVPKIGANESQNRFNLVFHKFIKVFTKAEHPLALFLDDLQWADNASLKLMELLMSYSSPGLFLIGAYRDNEVSAAHPLMLTLDEIAKHSGKINHIFLAELDLETITKMIIETVNKDSAQVKKLAELILLKTGGNPFFINEFFRSLYTENLLYFNRQHLQWQWNLAEIQARGFTDNVVELMAGKIQNLPENTQKLLKLAACIGNLFELNTLGLISNKSLGETVRDLLPAVGENLLIPVSNKGDIELAIAASEFLACPLPHNNQNLEYKFAHDRIQQAAYSLIPDIEKQTTHYYIGQLLLKQIAPETKEENIFKLVNQLNYGTSLIIQQTDKNELAQLNLIASRKARDSAAYQAAYEYIKIGLSLLGETAWQQEYKITLALYELGAEIALLCGKFDQMQEFINIVITEAQTLLDQVKVYQIQIQAKISQTQLAEAIAIAKQFLQQLGVTFPNLPTLTDIQHSIQEINQILENKNLENLVNLPIMTDSEKFAIIQTVNSIIPAAFLSASPLFPLLVSFSVKLSMQYGNTSYSAFSYAAYGIILCSFLDIDTATKFGKLAFDVTLKLNAKAIKPEVTSVLGGFILHRKFHAKETFSILKEGYKNGLEVGSLVFAGYNASNFCINAFWSGQTLHELEQDARIYYQELQQLKQLTPANYCRLHWECILLLYLSNNYQQNLLKTTHLSDKDFLPILLASNDVLTVYFFYLYKLTIGYFFGQIDSANYYALECRRYLQSGSEFICGAAFYFYDSLIALAQINLPLNQTSELWQRVTENQNQLQEYWAKYAPMNHQHKVDLILGEKNRLLGDKLAAMNFYDRAIKTAKNNQYINEAALAYELAAKFYLSEDKELIAKAYLQESYYYYQVWGAHAKVKQLEQQYPQFLTGIQLINYKDKLEVTTSGSSYHLDIDTIIKATNTISGEIVLDKLLFNLMKLLLENAGAQKGYLILNNNSKLLIEAFGDIDSEKITIFTSIPLETYPNISQTIVNYVLRTQASIVLSNASQESKFNNDIYIKQKQPKSILCVPLINQGQLVSIVYLENNLTIGAFTPERVQILQLLSGQAAISIKNAKLYTEVSNNEKRLVELNQAYQRFVPSQFLQFLEKSSIIDVKLGDQVQLKMSVLFSDIREFTTISETMTPEDNFKFINSYLSRMEPAIIENKGFIDKYIGDAIMALFSGAADNAVKAGISMLERLKIYNQNRTNSGYAPIKIGIGINTGSLMLGTVGGQNRMDTTVISDAVNLASRVESLTKNYGVSLLITEQTYTKLQNYHNYAIRIIDNVKVKGKLQSVTVYEVFDADIPEIKEGKLKTLKIFTEALSLYNQGNINIAAELLANCLKQNPGDRVSQIYFDRCQQK